MGKHEMTDEEIIAELEFEEEQFAERVWDKLQKQEYIVIDGSVIDPKTNELVCQLSIIGL